MKSPSSIERVASDAVSYPENANEAYAAIEEGSYWFHHRRTCLLALLARFPIEGPFHDIGAGNGYTCAGLEKFGVRCVAIEPGPGAMEARRRGISRVINATLGEADLASRSVTTAGAFDVIEHIEDEKGFLLELRRAMAPGGRFFCTVPAGPSLWSHEDEIAGHHRRYTGITLARSLEGTGFRVEFLSPLFTWLVPAVALLRALPFRVGCPRPAALRPEQLARDHSLPRAIRAPIKHVHAWEIRRIAAARRLPFGTSLIAVARAD